jgi:cytochrome P450/NADPH-cytochrome P450 reductase
MITLLFAGHETTSGLLSFTFYYLLSNPAEYVIAQKEVDDVVGNATITAAHLSRLPYLSAVLRESLRLSPTVPAIALTAKEDTILGGKYKIKAKMPIIALLAAVHRDRRVYGSDADAFRPERMLDEAFSRRNQDFPNCWKPFGNGMRGCVGRFFAQQQSLLVVALLLQSFDFSMSDPSYRLRTTQMTTVKPDGFRMRARPRQHLTPARLQRKTIIDSPQSARSTAVVDRNKAPKTVIDIFYGSNAGTCKVLANQLADHAASYGYAVGATGTLDDATEALSKRNAVVLLAASYDGQPASNAEKFVQWISTLQSNELAEVKFAVFGCGHRDWASTFLKVPTYLNETLEKRGGTRLAILGISDVAAGKVQSDFSTWETSFFWPAIRARYGAESTLQVKVYGPGTSTLRGGLRQARVLANTRLASSGLSLRKHLEVTLPPGLIYNTGDRLVVLPQNPRSVVRRALERLSLSPDSVLTISSTATTALPVDTPVRAAEVFRTYVELEQPASENDVLCLLDAVRDETSKIRLSHLANDARDLERPSVLDLLELFPAIDILPGAFLAMQPPMRLRQYCISSSPLWHPGHATVTYSVGDWSHTQASKKNIGTASTYLSSLTTADEMFVSIEKCAEEFRMPEPADDVPLILIAAGTGMTLFLHEAPLLALTVDIGLGPFRGFVQERAARIAAGRILATALLFYGCRSPDDDIYSESFQRWEQLGAVCIRRAYSSVSNQSQGCRYVQDRIYHDRADFIRLLAAGARVAVCVPQCAVADVRETLISMIEDSKTTDADTPSEGARTTPTERQPKIVWHLWTPPTPSI